jgi:hypothetical protein
MKRFILLTMILFIFGTSSSFASTTWVLWGINKLSLQKTDKGARGFWGYIDAFESKNDCKISMKELSREHEDYRYECLPVEINASEIVFY